ncbi:hypothetical protein Tco_0988235 [Tanacetum coccineum]|uniref:Reverse transcriptase domain-containing protein n=1 Tax=Tanacetum coccineum TaxID=301880 RepID=A0ABQ5EQB4_9ASTR
MSNEDSLWFRVIQAIHGSRIDPQPSLSLSLWNTILKEVIVLKNRGFDFLAKCSKRVGNGSNTQFWLDNWIGGNSFCQAFPRLFALETNRNISVEEKMAADVESSFRRHVRGGVEMVQLNDLVSILDTVLLSPYPDRWVYSLSTDGTFSVKDTRSSIDDMFLPSHNVPTRWWEVVWQHRSSFSEWLSWFSDIRLSSKVKGLLEGDADLKMPFKEAVKTPLSQRIIEFAGPEFKMSANIKLYDRTTDPEDHLCRFSSAANSGEWPMPVWCRMFQQTLDGSAKGWFKNLSQGSIDGRAELRKQFTTRFSTRRACFKDPTEITKIVRKANETLAAFKERWIVETGFITSVLEVMKISSFMGAHKCPSEEAFANTDLPKGEVTEGSRRPAGSVSRREDRFHKGGYGADRRRNEGRNTFNPRDGLVPYRAQTPYQAPRDQGFHHPKFNLSSLTKLPKEILASEPQTLHQRLFSAEKAARNGSRVGKLNHLIKDVRQRGRGNAKGRDVGKDKVINMIRSWPNDRKRKSVERDESWMKAPIVFPPLSMEDASDDPLIIEAVMEGYLVRRVYVDHGASVEVMFKHCFEKLSPAIRSRLRDTQMDLVGFAGGVVKPLGKIELEVVFGDGGLFRTVMINFTVVRVPSPYNVIFRRMGLRSLRAVSSTIHSMVKFPTPRGVATLVTRSAIISECRRLERKQMIEHDVSQNANQEKEAPERVGLTEHILVNLA